MQFDLTLASLPDPMRIGLIKQKMKINPTIFMIYTHNMKLILATSRVDSYWQTSNPLLNGSVSGRSKRRGSILLAVSIKLNCTIRRKYPFIVLAFSGNLSYSNRGKCEIICWQLSMLQSWLKEPPSITFTKKFVLKIALALLLAVFPTCWTAYASDAELIWGGSSSIS